MFNSTCLQVCNTLYGLWADAFAGMTDKKMFNKD
jgi:hypothetical protein